MEAGCFMIDIDVMQDASEIVHYDNPKIPIYIRHGLLSSYPDMKALCHWHEDIELIHILDGEMYYDINGHKLLLEEGNTLIVNAKQMHYGYSHFKRECSFSCILFHPSLLMTNENTSTLYLKPIIDNPNIEYFFFSSHTEIENLQKKIFSLKEKRQNGFELEIVSILFHFWNLLYQICAERNFIHLDKTLPTDLVIQKKMVSYIYQNYRETISLDDIANYGNVSISKCCSLFQKYLQQSPIDFVNSYRLEVSCNLLKNSTENISSIAFACGFNHLSYFSKLFYRKYGCTPRDFRKNSLYEPK